jgi:4'-phosphopantetheinyl transferase
VNRSITIDPGVKSLFVGVRALEPPDETVLSHDERERAERFHSSTDRERWVAGRSWLRTSLGARLDVDPSVIRFEYGPRGKPTIVWPHSSVAFSLSHSGPVAMLAIGGFTELGADIEQLRRDVYERRSAEIVLSPAEIDWIEESPDRDASFLRCWVRKEALGKALGIGLDSSLRAISLTPGSSRNAMGFRLMDLDRGGLVAAVAVPSGFQVAIEEVET